MFKRIGQDPVLCWTISKNADSIFQHKKTILDTILPNISYSLFQGPFGKVHYRLLDSDTPFVLFEADGEVTIYYVTKSENDFPDRSYTITVEAYDAKEYPR